MGVVRGAVGGGGCTVCRVCSVAAVACSCDTMQMCGEVHRHQLTLPAVEKASASSEVDPAFEVLECRRGYHRSELPCSVGESALNLRCSGASDTH